MADSHDHDHDHHDHGDEPDHAHHDFGPVAFALITVSTSRSLDDDPAGDAIVAAVGDDGGSVATRELVDDDYDGIQGRVNSLVNRDDVDVVVTTGGTGVTPDDVTVEAVDPLFDKRLPGFGELFRARSREEVGTRVVATRATAGVIEGVPAFCLPGSENAASLGAEIVTAEAGHLAGLAKRDEDVEDENADDGDSDTDADSDSDES
ncbi:molybdenum cofactor biosynthesis protein B [Halococcus sp. IIIV-5B]|uniref:MogA/MoaB family molybdenum cofactor biosynthesis protein n=1 Tax=Halococcus sp. IIIV-5B TaxID=2321230 RepID=UPI000E71D575|nr:molybdenum cofactor synthesis domain-containing protein [Halococcus sp. IIIV-5B]RJS99547.1 molybdenum cofactor biosynthesis protein B [Halococcus sp. IIIV-5B]